MKEHRSQASLRFLRRSVCVGFALIVIQASSAFAQRRPMMNAKRALTLPQYSLRIDVGAPERGLLDAPGSGPTAGASSIGGARGFRILHGNAPGPSGRTTFIDLGVGFGFGISDDIEVGTLAFPLLFAPGGFDYGDLELYGRYRFFRGDYAEIGVQVAFNFPTETEFAGALGLPMLFPLGDSAKLETGLELELIADDPPLLFYEGGGFEAYGEIPFALTFNLTMRGFMGFRTGITIPGFDEVACASWFLWRLHGWKLWSGRGLHRRLYLAHPISYRRWGRVVSWHLLFSNRSQLLLRSLGHTLAR